MLIEPLLAQLRAPSLHAIARALEQQRSSPDTLAMGFEDRLALLVQHEITERQSMKPAQRLRWARLPQQASIEDLDARHARGAQTKKSALFKSLARIELLVLDDFGLAPMPDEFRRDMLEVIDDRFGKTSTLITSQLPIAQWQRAICDPGRCDPGSAGAQRAPDRAAGRIDAQETRPLEQLDLTLIGEIRDPSARPFGVPTSNRNRVPTSIGMLYRHRRNTHSSSPRSAIPSA